MKNKKNNQNILSSCFETSLVYQISLYLCQDTYFSVGMCLLWSVCEFYLYKHAFETISDREYQGKQAGFSENEYNMWNQVYQWSVGASAPSQHLSLLPHFPTGPLQCQCPPLCSTSLLSIFTFTLALTAEHKQLCFQSCTDENHNFMWLDELCLFKQFDGI